MRSPATVPLASFAPRCEQRPASNDVFVDERGLIFLVDRVRGFHILERL